ncbi:hypothetical protein FY036_07755 [Mesorhizobium microcysteis]|uniref:Uncharacterized protein n=1 Tax=Neoaquamicrobium microcysteis TaxID=2682781 RepID=A0A5D4H1T0_9HYPH|nr:hypothetical protein [Mesorhizobium microcysteis]TYR33465.1 hypothetical protein FY036_07755 [Mesorhizobium microcysteis]
MKSNVAWLRQRVAALAIVTTSLSACATVGSDPVGVSVCPPVVEYSRELQMRAADELALLPDRSAIVAMMSDYEVMRNQARACRG